MASADVCGGGCCGGGCCGRGCGRDGCCFRSGVNDIFRVVNLIMTVVIVNTMVVVGIKIVIEVSGDRGGLVVIDRSTE